MKPAACILDFTNHGGKITVPVAPRKVLIGGMVAACMGDFQVCPMVDGVKPHVGGIVASGSTSVFINGLPAARAGDRVQCAGPPGNIIAVRKVFIGG
jgi:uncharacterized Zn-binding protein involved in type VI secretion